MLYSLRGFGPKWDRNPHEAPQYTNIKVFCRFRTQSTGFQTSESPEIVYLRAKQNRDELIRKKQLEISQRRTEFKQDAKVNTDNHRSVRLPSVTSRQHSTASSSCGPQQPRLTNSSMSMVRRSQRSRSRSPPPTSPGSKPCIPGAHVSRKNRNSNLTLPELPKKKNTITDIDFKRNEVNTWLPNCGPRKFSFEGVFDSTHDQTTLYDEVAKSVCQNALLGYLPFCRPYCSRYVIIFFRSFRCIFRYNGTLFVYGQTGSGKTYTMFGPEMYQTVQGRLQHVPQTDSSKFGIVPRTCVHILDSLRAQNVQFTLQVSFVEIYNNRVSDLLNQGSAVKLREKSDGCFVMDAKCVVVQDLSQVWDIISTGLSQHLAAITSPISI